MKKGIIAVVVAIAAFAGGYFAANGNCGCGQTCACTACNCTK